jgi:hypothetical protein
MVAAVNSALCAPIMRSHCRSHAVQLASVSRETLLACSPGYVVNLPAFRVAVLISITAAITTVVRKGRATPSTFDSDAAYPASVAQSLSLRLRGSMAGPALQPHPPVF